MGLAESGAASVPMAASMSTAAGQRQGAQAVHRGRDESALRERGGGALQVTRDVADDGCAAEVTQFTSHDRAPAIHTDASMTVTMPERFA